RLVSYVHRSRRRQYLGRMTRRKAEAPYERREPHGHEAAALLEEGHERGADPAHATPQTSPLNRGDPRRGQEGVPGVEGHGVRRELEPPDARADRRRSPPDAEAGEARPGREAGGRMSRALHLLAETPEAESPAQHLRNAVQLLILADERLAALTIPPDA